jgi:hypothetical protein
MKKYFVDFFGISKYHSKVERDLTKNISLLFHKDTAVSENIGWYLYEKTSDPTVTYKLDDGTKLSVYVDSIRRLYVVLMIDDLLVKNAPPEEIRLNFYRLFK